MILREFHCSRFAVHPSGTKMYQDLRRQYYLSGMKRHVGDFVRRCLTDELKRHKVMSRQEIDVATSEDIS